VEAVALDQIVSFVREFKHGPPIAPAANLATVMTSSPAVAQFTHQEILSSPPAAQAPDRGYASFLRRYLGRGTRPATISPKITIVPVAARGGVAVTEIWCRW
jgi:hypothetical protein